MASIFPLFVPAIRDYIDVLNSAYDSISSTNNLQQILQQSILYFASSIKFIVIYFFSFQWIQDLSYLPIVIPQIKLEILKEHVFFDTPQSNFFTFLETPSYTYNKFFLGLINSFFLCLPLSIAHIISVRRLLIQGLAAGISSSFGTISGQILVFVCILFGGRFFITPWFNFQILNYFIGTWLVVKVFYDMATEQSIRIVDSSNRTALIKFFFINFTLAWTEQSCIFQYFGNLTLGAEPSIIEIFSSGSSLQSVLVHINYILGIIVGSVLFTSLFIFTTLKLSELILSFLSILYSTWIRRLNFSLIIVILAFTLTSIPFYSLEYLVLSNLGFSPQDKSLKNTNTVFSYTKIHDVKVVVLGNQYENISPKRGILTDGARFNKGRYLMFDINDSFEQLNYKGEYTWFVRRSREPRITLDIASNPTLSKASKFFKKGQKFRNQSNKKQFVNTSSNNNVVGSDNAMISNPYKDNSAKKVFAFRNESKNMINQSFESLVNTSVSKNFFVSQEMRLTNLEKNFKQKYYSNPIYKLLLSADIDFFLSRQPTSFLLSPKQEHELFKKRTVLSNYYDSLRYYNSLPYAPEFQDFFNGSKSYADRIYNHQFNGTLKMVRRLFSINIDSTLGSIEERSNSGATEPSINNLDKKQNLQNQKNIEQKFLEKDTTNFILKFDQPLYKKINALDDLNTPFHEELNLASLENNLSDSEHLFRERIASKQFNKPFIELVNPIPFYVGWDEQLRKLVITNRLSPNYCAGECMKFLRSGGTQDSKSGNGNRPFGLESDIDATRKMEQGESTSKNNKYLTLNKLIKKNKTINFTAWPIPYQTGSQLPGIGSYKPGIKNQTSYNLLFGSLKDPENNLKFRNLIQNDPDLSRLLNGDTGLIKTYGELSSIPINILKNKGNERASGGELNDIIPYTRGGFIWPGHSDLKFKFKELRS